MSRGARGILNWGAAIALGMATLGAAHAGAETASVSASLESDGRGLMIANSQTNPDTETWSWEVCSPDLLKCSPFGTGRIVTTVGATSKRRFRATSNLGATAVSPLWGGKPAAVTPPSIHGPLRANELVTPVPSEWKRGWRGDFDITQLAACRSRRSRGCTTLTHTNYVEACPGGAAVLDPVFAGQYLRVANRRLGPDTGSLDYGVGSPYGRGIWKRDPTTSVAIVGRIAKATGPRTNSCGAPPLSEAPDLAAAGR